ncbi:MAG: hypothetical protein KKD05_00950 [Candidatus Omnitrophica bacterium]|nr:hypothetical protein [Candidatus Omnitrophota bacterium]
MFEKIKKYIKIFDCLTKVEIAKNKLIATFECINGGSYETVNFELIFDNPYIYRMPYFNEGEFEIELIENLNEQDLIEKQYPEGFEKLFVIRNKKKNLVFYVLCDDIDFKISGRNYHIKGEKELLID